MSKCLSAQDRDYIIWLGGAVGVCESIIESGDYEDLHQDLGHAIAHLQSAMTAMLATATRYQLEEAKGFCSGYETAYQDVVIQARCVLDSDGVYCVCSNCGGFEPRNFCADCGAKIYRKNE